MKLRLSSDFSIDTDQYKREGLRFSILAMSGHGKSNAAADLVEDVLEQHGQVIIIEPIPEWHTLKARFNTVVVIGGPYQDLPLEASFAHEYVKAALEKGISLVVNVSDIEEDADQIKFVSSFLWNLYRLEQKYRRVLFLVLEEADIWAPQMWDQTSKQSLSRVSLIAKHGRKIGIFPILISQRPADLHKSPLSQCNINLFGKFTSPADLDPKTGLMFVVKKQHLNITEEQIMTLPTGSFVVSHKGGVDTIAVRKRLCPHGADTPLIEPKPFTADLSNALGGLRDEIAKSIAAKKDEESVVKRLEKENGALRTANKELAEKANIKISVKEMMEGNGSVHDKTHDSVHDAELEEYRSGRKLAENVQQRLDFLGKVKIDLEKRLNAADKALEAYSNLQCALRTAINVQNIYDNIHRVEEKIVAPQPQSGDKIATAVGLQKVTTVVDVPSSEKLVTVNTENMRGKILTVARKGKLDSWRKLDEIVKAVEEEHWSATSQEVNNALNDLEKQDLIAKKHSDRNYYCLAQGVKFKEGS
ncbi:DUF87 domain-containing protein [Candidatus Bathyarchaeota archaeon]|nr:DUF87 domain-containing protein [Candidatus Bathyarchaeota archaeon]